MKIGRVRARIFLRSLYAEQSFPKSPVNNRNSRAFHTSKPLAVVRPFLLSDIGEGREARSRFPYLDAY